ncbi:MAG: hypothetical protein H7A37_01230 [Chlamydiales bacterium]|nr:hypothetical protein [Chlamydiia bacterium]MCP5506916.1 hypothetical protein [Chlamydiales bacterium]
MRRLCLLLGIGLTMICHSGYAGAGGDDNAGLMLIAPEELDTVFGIVVGVEQIQQLSGVGNHMALKVKTARGPMLADIGPSWFLQNQGVAFNQNDLVRLHGTERDEGFLTTRILLKDHEVRIREDDGTPIWSAWSDDDTFFQMNGSSFRQTHGSPFNW